MAAFAASARLSTTIIYHMKLATWNVNSLKVRLPQVLQWLQTNPVDVLCLQETKLTDDKFPVAEIEAAGYQIAFTGQKTYNGVAILAKEPLTDVVKNNPLFPDEQQRIIAATVGGMRVVCAYIPNGQAVGSDKYRYKLAWLDALHDWLADELRSHDNLAILGDYNIAPDERDVHDPAAWEGQVLFSEPERAAFRRLAALGLRDAFRLFEQPEKIFSWWDYRMMAFRRNMGLRIDHILLSPPLAARCSACEIDRLPRKWEQPSDHAPVIATLD
jgi:exodeoxyribonuclease-3